MLCVALIIGYVELVVVHLFNPCHGLLIYQFWYIMRSMNGKQIIRKLESEGWKLDRVNGSHHIMHKNGITVSVPVHGSSDIKKGTLSSIQKQTGVKLK